MNEYVFRIEDRDRCALSSDFIAQYAGTQPKWGPLGHVVFKRTYARRLTEEQRFVRTQLGIAHGPSSTEEFWECIRRCSEGTFSVLRHQIRQSGQRWDQSEGQQKMQKLFSLLWKMRILLPGRGFQNMGASVVEKKGAACLNSCGMVSTTNIDFEFARPFTMLMDYSMLGVGMGFDTEGAGKVNVRKPSLSEAPHVIEDTREAWVAALERVLNAFVGIGTLPRSWDVSLIRKEGTPIHTFGGTASGPKPLLDLLDSVEKILRTNAGSPITSVTITDIMNLIGRCVVSGNVRRSAEIALGSPEDAAFLKMKDNSQINAWKKEQSAIAQSLPEWKNLDHAIKSCQSMMDRLSPIDPAAIDFLKEKNTYEIGQKDLLERNRGWMDLQEQIDAHPLRSYRWASNNSLIVSANQDYSEFAKQTAINGEPGYFWIDTARRYGRLMDPPNDADLRAKGTNPCVTADTIVTTADGPKSVQDLIGVPFSALIHGKQYRSQTGFFETGVKEVFLLKTEEGHSLRLTDNHPLLCATKITRKKRYQSWKEVKDISPGDYVVLNENGGNKWDGEGSLEQGWLLGELLGDGHFHSSSDSAKVQFWGVHRKFLLDLAIKRISTLDTRYNRNRTGSHVEERDMSSVASVALKKLAESFGINTSKDIKSDKLLKSSYEFHRGFIRGFFDSDGSVQGNHQKGISVRLSSVKIQHLKVVQQMLLNLGINSTIYENRRKKGFSVIHGKKYDTQPTNELVVADSNICSFAEIVGFESPDKTEKLSSLMSKYKRKLNQERFVAKVESISSVGLETVFDCNIDDIHCFSANGIIAHNCSEQTLWDSELCNLVETCPTLHDTLSEFLETLKYAFLYAKVVTCIPTHNETTNSIIARNRRIGTSMAGVWEMYETLGIRECRRWWNEGYQWLKKWDKEYSGWMGVPLSIKLTSIKPGGTTPLMAGVEGGMKSPTARFYMRTIRIEVNSPLVKALERSGYRTEEDVSAPRTIVAYFPCKEERCERVARDISLWEQAELFTDLQSSWSDNQVSATLTFKPEEIPDIERVLQHFTGRWKSVSFLPLWDHAFPQAPYIPITEAEYLEAVSRLKPLVLEEDIHDQEDRFCSGAICEIAR